MQSLKAYLDLHDDVVTSIRERNRSQRVEDAKDSVCTCEAIQVVLSAWLLPRMSCNPNGNGGVANGHDCCCQGDDTQLVEVGNLHANQDNEVMHADDVQTQQRCSRMRVVRSVTWGQNSP